MTTRTREQRQLLDQLERFLPTLAAHRVGYKAVVEMVRQFAGDLLDKVVRIMSREFILLSKLVPSAFWTAGPVCP